MATDSLFKITKSVCEWDYTRFARYNRKDCEGDEEEWLNQYVRMTILYVIGMNVMQNLKK